MGCFGIQVGQVKVVFDHLQGGVGQQFLQDKDISPITKKIDSKGMAEAVRVGVLHAGALADTFDEPGQGLALEVLIVIGGEEGIFGPGIGPGGEIAPDGFGGFGGDLDGALLVAFALDAGDTVIF